MADFDLNLWIGGLCMLVPDPQQHRLHVLMPATAAHPHNPVVMHDVGSAQQGAYAVNGVLDLSSVGSGPPDLSSIPAGVLDLTAATGRPVSRSRMAPAPDGPVRTLVTLAAGARSRYNPGHNWELPAVSPPRCMATDLMWTIPMQGDSFNLGAFINGAPVLTPRPGPGGRLALEVRVLHIPDPPYPHGDPKPGELAPHTDHYYDILDPPLPVRPIPSYVGRCTTADPAETRWPPEPLYIFFDNPRCILSQATVA